MRFVLPLSLTVMVLASACSQDALIGNIKTKGTRVQTRGAATDLDCPAGGVVLEYGIDTNANGKLDPLEVNGIEVVCNGEDGQNAVSSLVHVSEEPVGDNCSMGGTRIQQGADTNLNGTLDQDEVTEVSYVCHGENGATGATGGTSLILLSDVLEVDDCPGGGVRVETGVDRNNNGALDAAEVDDVAYICHGVNGAPGQDSPNTLLANHPVEANEHCPAGGVLVQSGLDINGNQLLDTAEVRHSSYVCNGTTAAAGMSCTVTDNGDGTKTITCPDGTSVNLNDGQQGVAGTSASCSVTDNGNGTATISCTDGTTATIANGADAVPNVMTSSIFCTGDLEDTEMSFHYTVAQFALGDVFVSGGIFGEYTEVTNSTMYSLYQNGYHQAPITFTHDSLWDHNGGFWEISLDRGTLVTTIDYRDIDGDVSWEMVPEDCVVNTY